MQINLRKALLLVLIGLGGLAFGQTKMIALKSHSGNPMGFDPAGQGNLGIVEPPPRLDSIVKINDSTVVRYMNNDFGPYYYDTLINDGQWLKSDLNLDSVRKYYEGETAIIGFETQQLDPTKKQRPPKLKKRKKLKETQEKNTLIIVNQSKGGQSKSYKGVLILGLFFGCLSLSFLIFRKRSVINV